MLSRDAKIYIAGHRGLVGSAILRVLKKKKCHNIILRTSRELDLRSQRDTGKFFEKEKPDYVFLAAAKVGGIMANNTYKAQFIYDNIMIASNVIHSAYECGVKKLLNLGSSCIYPKLAPQPMKEEYLLTGLLESTNEPYAVAKIAAIKLCQYYNEQYNTNFISVMPTNLYGTNDNFSLETAHVLPALIRKFHIAKLLRNNNKEAVLQDIKKFPVGFNFPVDGKFNPVKLKKLGITSESVELWGSGNPYREFLHVDDLANATLFLMENYNENQFINIGVGEDQTIRELAEMVRTIVGFEGKILWDTSKPEGTPRKLLDVSRIKSLGWTPKITLEDGIRKTYEWYVSFFS
jgi:GDP-L-fucose synthase